MTGRTLMISRAVENHDFYIKEMADLGFSNPSVTALDRDALNSFIRELQPELILMCARYYHGCTPFMMGGLHRNFPEIKTAAISIGEYPDELAMYFILNGINSYVASFDGVDQFYSGLKDIAKGRDYISPGVMKRIEMRREYPMPAGILTERHKEVIRLVCNGWKELEIADVLHISRKTVDRHKTDIFTSLNVRSSLELIHVALRLELVTLEELCFRHSDFTVNPIPDKKIKKRRKE
jgi:DNA-binding NarL/FixJ family response regulator